MRRLPWFSIILVLLPITILWIFLNYSNYFINDFPSFFYPEKTKIDLGISIVEQDISNLLNETEQNFLPNDKKALSFLLQSPLPTAQIYLDYIAIHNDKDLPETVCFISISIPRSDDVPFEIVPQVDLGNLVITSKEYKYNFPRSNDEWCIGRGAQKITPHILLGIITAKSYTKFPLVSPIKGKFDAFPFDREEFAINVTVQSEEIDNFSPSIKAVVSQKGWVGNIDLNEEHIPVLYLYRHIFFRFIFLLFIAMMIIIIPFLNSVIDEHGSFFEVLFSILLSLWGLHDILIPDYIQSSLVVDGVIYFLYIMVFLQILRELFKTAGAMFVQIVHIEYDPPGKDLDGEYVEIKNQGFIPFNITEWVLFDKARNKFTFPSIVLRGNKSIKIWTKEGQNNQSDLYWGRKIPLWNNEGDTATLEDNKGKVIDEFSYTKK